MRKQILKRIDAIVGLMTSGDVQKAKDEVYALRAIVWDWEPDSKLKSRR